ncbi:MAG: hypothetical protein BRC40_07845 [Cyanobacteria bacterium QH_8_48_120]|nr:MAG: hypothetical protein BRC40_07845 [Cyanobacteria bacterium QH_8_48_120]
MGGKCWASGSWNTSTACWKCWSVPRPWFPISPPALVVERTLAWISRCRRLSQDNEKLPRTWETFIYLAMIEVMLKRVAETLATSKTPSNSG